MASTIKEIAIKAGVSHSTVSRLLSGDQQLRISETKAREIREVIKKSGGCQPHRTARGLVSRRAEVIVWPINKDQKEQLWHSSYIIKTTMEGVEEVLRENGFRLSVTFFSDPDKLTELPSLFDRRDFADGAFLSWSIVNRELAQIILEKRYPHVGLDPAVENLGINCVLADELTGISQAVSHLADCGHRRIGFIGRSVPLPRFETFRKLALNLGLEMPQENIILEPLDSSSSHWETDARKLGKDAFSKLLKQGKFTAVFCENDAFAFGAVDAMRELGMEPGHQISLVGFDDIESVGWVPFGEPLLTTVHYPLRDIGIRAARVLLDQVMNGWREPKVERVETKLVIRKTVGQAC
ncbi:MAG: LacI family DNA-binding transcriptional regulator [Phycisphaerae bacterium]